MSKEPIFSPDCPCQGEVSLPASELRLLDGELWCSECYYYEHAIDEYSNWTDLPQFIPEADKRIAEMDKWIKLYMSYEHHVISLDSPESVIDFHDYIENIIRANKENNNG